MSVVKPVRYICEPLLALCRLSQLLPSQAIGPCTRCATSTIGCSAIFAPSNAQPPAAAPGVSCLVQPFLRSFALLAWFLSQPGSSNTCRIFSFSLVDMAGSRIGIGRTRHQQVRGIRPLAVAGGPERPGATRRDMRRVSGNSLV